VSTANASRGGVISLFSSDSKVVLEEAEEGVEDVKVSGSVVMASAVPIQ